MQTIPATGMTHAIKDLQSQKIIDPAEKRMVLCSLGDGSITEGEVSEAWQMAVLRRY